MLMLRMVLALSIWLNPHYNPIKEPTVPQTVQSLTEYWNSLFHIMSCFLPAACPSPYFPEQPYSLRIPSFFSHCNNFTFKIGNMILLHFLMNMIFIKVLKVNWCLLQIHLNIIRKEFTEKFTHVTVL